MNKKILKKEIRDKGMLEVLDTLPKEIQDEYWKADNKLWELYDEMQSRAYSDFLKEKGIASKILYSRELDALRQIIKQHKYKCQHYGNINNFVYDEEVNVNVCKCSVCGNTLHSI